MTPQAPHWAPCYAAPLTAHRSRWPRFQYWQMASLGACSALPTRCLNFIKKTLAMVTPIEKVLQTAETHTYPHMMALKSAVLCIKCIKRLQACVIPELASLHNYSRRSLEEKRKFHLCFFFFAVFLQSRKQSFENALKSKTRRNFPKD